MVSKIRKAMSNDHFGEYVLAYLPIAGIRLRAIAFVTVSLVRGGIGQ